MFDVGAKLTNWPDDDAWQAPKEVVGAKLKLRVHILSQCGHLKIGAIVAPLNSLQKALRDFPPVDAG